MHIIPMKYREPVSRYIMESQYDDIHALGEKLLHNMLTVLNDDLFTKKWSDLTSELVISE